MQDDIAIKVENVSKRFLLPHEKKTSLKSIFTSFFNGKTTYTKQQALEDISFEIKKGEFFGIVGRNGSGKSTLLKIIAGIYQPTKGKISVNGKLVPFIELGVGFNPELTGRENVYLNGSILGFTRKQVQKNYHKIVEFSELKEFMDQKLKNYSSGMQVRLAFACATLAKADILLVDEVLAVGDADFQRKCFEYFRRLKKERKTVIFVTHDMNSVREYCDRAMLIDDSRKRYIGKSERVAQEYSRLFFDETSEATDQSSNDKANKNWGNGDAKFSKVTAKQIKDKIVISAKIKANKSIKEMLYGVHIFSTNGSELTATNNRMIFAPDIENLKEGDEVNFTWEVLNIFNDGKYLVSLTLVDSIGTVFDWNNEAASFNVKRLERSTTPIIPPIEVSAEIVNNKGATKKKDDSQIKK